MKRGKQRIKISLDKPLRALLDQLAGQKELEQRLHEVETRVKRLEQRGRATNQTGAIDTLDAGIFFTDADDPPALSDQQQASYEAWHDHFNLHPEEIEPGRTVHEMAALRASTPLPTTTGGIDQKP